MLCESCVSCFQAFLPRRASCPHATSVPSCLFQTIPTEPDSVPVAAASRDERCVSSSLLGDPDIARSGNDRPGDAESEFNGKPASGYGTSGGGSESAGCGTSESTTCGSRVPVAHGEGCKAGSPPSAQRMMMMLPGSHVTHHGSNADMVKRVQCMQGRDVCRGDQSTTDGTFREGVGSSRMNDGTCLGIHKQCIGARGGCSATSITTTSTCCCNGAHCHSGVRCSQHTYDNCECHPDHEDSGSDCVPPSSAPPLLLSHLPDCLLPEVLRHLNVNDLLMSAYVSRSFREAALADMAWEGRLPSWATTVSACSALSPRLQYKIFSSQGVHLDGGRQHVCLHPLSARLTLSLSLAHCARTAWMDITREAGGGVGVRDWQRCSELPGATFDTSLLLRQSGGYRIATLLPDGLPLALQLPAGTYSVGWRVKSFSAFPTRLVGEQYLHSSSSNGEQQMPRQLTRQHHRCAQPPGDQQLQRQPRQASQLQRQQQQHGHGQYQSLQQHQQYRHEQQQPWRQQRQQPQTAAAGQQATPPSPPPPPPLVATTSVQVAVSGVAGRHGSEVEVSQVHHTLMLPDWHVVPVGTFTVGDRLISPLPDVPPPAASSSMGSSSSSSGINGSSGTTSVDTIAGCRARSPAPGCSHVSTGYAVSSDIDAAVQSFYVRLQVELQQPAGRPQPQVVWDCLVLDQLEG